MAIRYSKKKIAEFKLKFNRFPGNLGIIAKSFVFSGFDRKIFICGKGGEEYSL
jgi:hypothetical protein